MVECSNNTGHNGQRFLSEASFGRSTLANSSKHRAPRLILTWNEEIPTGSLRNQPLPLSHSLSLLFPFSSSHVLSSGIKRHLKQGFKTNREESHLLIVKSLHGKWFEKELWTRLPWTYYTLLCRWTRVEFYGRENVWILYKMVQEKGGIHAWISLL